MILATNLERIFIIDDNGKNVRLSDPNSTWSEQAVMNYYSNDYPILATARISAPKITNDSIEYHFESVFGTKG